VELFFSLLCHQIAERSPQLGGEAFPLCFRCSGLYFGMFAAYCYLLATGGLRRSMPGVAALISAAVLMMPFIVDGWGNTLALWSSPAWLRALSGVAHGTVLPLLLVPLASGRDPFRRDAAPTASRPAHLLVPLALGLLLLAGVFFPISRAEFAALKIVAFVGFALFAGNSLATISTCRTMLSSVMRDHRESA
jgi:uncharacterized membrane protein